MTGVIRSDVIDAQVAQKFGRTQFPGNVFDLADVALEIARTDPGRIAVIQPDGRSSDGTRTYTRYTYEQLSMDVESVAIGLREMGIVERTRTVFMTPPSYGGCVVGLALTRVGATTVWIDPSVGYFNVAERLRRLKPEAFVGLPIAHLGRMTFGWGARFGMKCISIGPALVPGTRSWQSLRRPVPPTGIVRADVKPTDTAAIMYTTGSTGPAKPTLYEQRNLCAIHRLVQQTWRFERRPTPPIDMPVFPAFFTVGLSAGGTIVIPPINYVRQTPSKVDPRALLEVINDCKVETLFASPVILENVARLGSDEGAVARSLHTVVGGGAPLYAHVIGPLRAMIADDGEVHADYGATEALPATEMAGAEAMAETYGATARGAGLCVGRPFDGVELRIVEITDGPIRSLGRVRELPAGEIGEIIVRGPHVSPCYADDTTSTLKNKITDAEGVWHRLGDAGYLDRSGRLWVAGRVGHRLALPDGPMFPLMCEPIFDAHPDVKRSGLVGVPVGDTVVPVICIELFDGSTRGPKVDMIRDQLLKLAVAHPTTRKIRVVLFLARLPVDPRHNSKIERPALARWAAKHLPRHDQESVVRELAATA